MQMKKKIVLQRKYDSIQYKLNNHVLMNENRHTLFDVLKPELLSAALHHNSVEDSFNLYIYIWLLHYRSDTPPPKSKVSIVDISIEEKYLIHSACWNIYSFFKQTPIHNLIIFVTSEFVWSIRVFKHSIAWHLNILLRVELDQKKYRCLCVINSSNWVGRHCCRLYVLRFKGCSPRKACCIKWSVVTPIDYQLRMWREWQRSKTLVICFSFSLDWFANS